MEFSTNAEWQAAIGSLTGQLAERDAEVAELLNGDDPDGLRRRIARLRAKLTEKIGLDFTRCPLRVEAVDAIAMPGYTIEKVTIESLPGYRVPINVYVPAGGRRHPAVLMSMGHNIEGKHNPEIQLMCANLALRGFVAAVFDPICEGERDMYPDRREQWHKQDIWMVEEHMRVGNQSYALGESSAKYFIWDGMRVLDYLCDRPDVDPERIGCAGQSGGGTATYYLAALDDRVKVAAPIQCLTKQRMALQRTGITDPEQTIFALWDEFAFDLPDFLWLCFPKPLLMIAGLKDYFFIEGAREIAAEVGLLYRQLGRAEAFALAEVDTGHQITREVRLRCYQWLERWLTDGDGGPDELEVAVLPEERLHCFGPTQRPGTAMELNAARFAEVSGAKPAWEDPESMRAAIGRIAGLRERPYRVDAEPGEGYLVRPEGGYPALNRLDGEAGQPLVVFVDFNVSFDADAVKQALPGHARLFIEPFAMATTAAKQVFQYDLETALAYSSFLTGGSLAARRVESVVSSVREALRRTQNTAVAALCGTGQGAQLAMLAAVAEPAIRQVFGFEGVASFEAIFDGEDYFVAETSIVPGLAGRYDTVDLMVALADRMSAFVNPVDRFQRPTASAGLRELYRVRTGGRAAAVRIDELAVDGYLNYLNHSLETGE